MIIFKKQKNKKKKEALTGEFTFAKAIADEESLINELLKKNNTLLVNMEVAR